MKYSICSPWEFTEQWSEDFLNFRLPAQQVALPHTCKEVPLHFADSHSYQMVCGYLKSGAAKSQKAREKRKAKVEKSNGMSHDASAGKKKPAGK